MGAIRTPIVANKKLKLRVIHTTTSHSLLLSGNTNGFTKKPITNVTSLSKFRGTLIVPSERSPGHSQRCEDVGVLSSMIT